MSRPIKFRLYELSGESSRSTDGCVVLALDGKVLASDHYCEIDEALVLQQFTGIVDKNGTEIYEGDILATSNDGKDGADVWEQETMGVVEWDKKNAMFRGLPDTDDGTIYAVRYVEVIGNILKNPELIPDYK